MRSTIRALAVIAALLVGVAASSTAASADPNDPNFSTHEFSQNMHPLGSSSRAVPFTGPGSGVFNSDLAFWGNRAIQGTYAGFRIIDIAEPGEPEEIVNWTECSGPLETTGNQGDVIVWEEIVVRSWNSPTPAAGSHCGDFPMTQGQEGVHVIDISDPTAPEVVAFVETDCGSHTATGVPDLANNRLLVYNSSSSAACPGVDIIEVPLGDPSAASFLRSEPSGVPGALANLVTIDPPSAAAGTYQATGAEFGAAPDETGISGDVAVVNDGTAAPTQGCNPLVGFPAGAIALVDRGTCSFVQKAGNAQAAGASAMIVANNVAGAPITMGGTDPAVTIPSVMVSQADGTTIKGGLPAAATISRNPQPQVRSCHDTGVILGDAMLAGCAGGNGFSVWSLDPADGGSLEDPALLYSRSVPGVSIGHSASFSWDGEVVVFGHEPGGGGQAQCQATTPEVNRTMFFFESTTGVELGRHVLPRPQTNNENCTIHNYNVVPTAKGRVLVHGSYQSGIGVVDFTDPANAREIAFADPAPLSNASLVLGGDWSTYWYDGFIYESDIRRGVLNWRLSDPAVAGAQKLGHLNPQTQETTL